MSKKRLGRVLTILILAAFVVEEIGMDVKAYIPETVSTGTQADAIMEDADNKAKNASEYEKINGNEDESLDEESQESDEDEEIEIVWEEVHLKTADDLIDFAKKCRLDAYSANKKVYLDADIVMPNIDFEGIPYFNGQFFGQGNKISSVRIDAEESYLGFFSRLDYDAVVSGLKIEGHVIPQGAQTLVGGIVGDNKGIISDCSFEGTVCGEDYVGGIAGINELTGIILDSKSYGVISGTHFTGGIAGENMGNIIDSANESCVNITDRKSTVSIEDISLDTILSEAGIGDVDKDEVESSAMVNGTVDMGGIAGISIGVIQNCSNTGTIGYKNVGYNVGGIVGRQSGYVYSCSNSGTIYGRKDVGGIVGQAEPYVTIDFANDITSQLSENIEKLHDILTVTLNDADSGSDTIANRLAVIKGFADNALIDTRYLENETIDWANSVVSTANEALSRVDYILDEASKKDGVMDKSNDAVADAIAAAGQLKNTVNDLDLEKYMSESQKSDYNDAKNNIDAATRAYEEFEKEVNKTAAYNYSIHYYIGTGAYNGALKPSSEIGKTENDVQYKDGDNVIFGAGGSPTISPKLAGETWDVSDASALTTSNTKYNVSGNWVHSSDNYSNLGGASDADQNSLDERLMKDAASGAAEIAASYADKKYKNEYSESYADVIKKNSETMADIISRVAPELAGATKEDATKALTSLENSMANIKSAGEQAKSIVKTLSDKSDLSLPSFSANYKLHANSLTNNIQGMSDNFGLLSSEMNGASDNLIGDLKGVNDQFNVIMLLFTDALDGVLDNDYSNTYTDNSLEVCKTTTDATVDKCTNTGTVEGSIDVAGICGTMAIEYDFDLESDVTGVKDAALNKSYQTKCVLRNNVNKGPVTSEKDYVGGMCGLQEMGTITGGENYGKITSSSASYVGGIAGSSVSSIVNSFAKCALSGKSYVGGIAGDGARIYDSFTMVTVSDAVKWYGAIAGHIDDNSDIRNNFFTSTELSGIDRVSYKGMAEPVEYSDISEQVDNVPQNFSNVFITYMLDENPDSDDDEAILLEKKAYNFGQKIEKDEYPDIPVKEGYYGVWDISEIDAADNDNVITASYVRYNTTLASDIVRSSNRSALLIDGLFNKEDYLNALLCVNEADRLPGMKEYWEIDIPDDGQKTHMVRYMKPDDMDDWPDIYVLRNESWELIGTDNIGNMGEYRTFEVEGNNVKLQMVHDGKGKEKIKNILIVIVAVIGLFIVVVVLVFMIRSRKKVRSKVKKSASKFKERVESREPAIKFVDESDLDEGRS